MGADAVLALLQKSGLTVAAENDRLAVSPASNITDELRCLIRENKPGLLTLIKKGGLGATERPGNHKSTAGKLEAITHSAMELADLVRLVAQHFQCPTEELELMLRLAGADPLNARRSYEVMATESKLLERGHHDR